MLRRKIASAEPYPVPSTASYPRIPYGVADFKRIRAQNRLYVDKTRFVQELEAEDYAVLIRPRRFGKTCWVSTLEHYYDRTRADAFESVFGGTDIGRNPTANRNRYVVLRFNFSAFDDTLATLRENFERYCDLEIRYALGRNGDVFSELASRRILAPPTVNDKLNELFAYSRDHGILLCVLIDEYDNFANNVLVHHGEDAYHGFTHGEGFYRSFFATLKAGTERSDGGVERLFVTGVSSITLDDVTSGFNIGANLSLDARFNEMLGFTDCEVRGLLEMYRHLGVFRQDVDTALAVMREWYDGYRFAKSAANTLYNTDMVLYFLKSSVPNGAMPDDLIDVNVRIDYGKLRHLLVVNRELNGNFDVLQHVIGEGQVDADIHPSFPLQRLGERENFISLLYYFGLLSIRDASRGTTRLGIPNQTVRRLLYGYLRDAYRDVDVFSVSQLEFAALMRDMAYDGVWRSALVHLAEAVAKQTRIRTYIDGERTVHAFLAAHFSLVGHFLIHTEYELNKGYADIYLEPFVARYREVAYGYVIEVKYVKRGETLDASLVAEKSRQAKRQLHRYLKDDVLRRRHPSVRHVGLALVFHGWEMVSCEAVSPMNAAR